MKYAVVFIVFGALAGFYAITAQSLVLEVVLGSSAVAFLGVGLAYAFLGPRSFLKKPGGALSPASYLLFWPYHLLNALSLAAFRWSAREHPVDRIDDRIYLGCRLQPRDLDEIRRMGITSVLDLTAEFGELPALRQLSYRCIPILDTYAPTAVQLTDGAEWILREAARGPVYVHCALGHGRSAMFVAAYLLLSGQARTAEEAVDAIRAIRPGIGMHPQQLTALREFAAALSAAERP